MTSGSQEVPDVDLLHAAASGDEAAFGELYRRHHRPVYQFALHVTGSTATAEDVMQDVFLALIGTRVTYEPSRGSFRTYLYGVARHMLHRHRRYARVFTSLDDEPALAAVSEKAEGDPLDSLMQAEQLRRLHRAILTLPPRYREAVVLCHMHGLGYAQAAPVLGCTEGTVASRLNRARALLIRKLRMTCLT